MGLLASATTPFLPQDFATLVNPREMRAERDQVIQPLDAVHQTRSPRLAPSQVEACNA